jgi:hypothetical protein
MASSSRVPQQTSCGIGPELIVWLHCTARVDRGVDRSVENLL